MIGLPRVARILQPHFFCLSAVCSAPTADRFQFECNPRAIRRQACRRVALVLYTPARSLSNCEWISGLHLDCVGITDCVRLLVWEMKHVVSAVIELDCVPRHAVGLDDWYRNLGCC